MLTSKVPGNGFVIIESNLVSKLFTSAISKFFDSKFWFPSTFTGKLGIKFVAPSDAANIVCDPASKKVVSTLNLRMQNSLFYVILLDYIKFIEFLNFSS